MFYACRYFLSLLIPSIPSVLPLLQYNYVFVSSFLSLPPSPHLFFFSSSGRLTEAFYWDWAEVTKIF